MRQSEFPIHPLILNRWSSRSMSGDPLSHEELMSLFEAARWAPSSYNAQPWRFIFAKKKTPHWNRFFELLTPFNQSWATHAAVLVLILSHKIAPRNEELSITHSFDAGAAWENLALEGFSKNLVVHAMQGFDYDKARLTCEIPHEFHIEAMIAIGKPGKKETLPTDLQKRESPSTRIPLKDLVMEGKFKTNIF